MTSLCRVSLLTIPRIPFKCLKLFWSSDLDRLKKASLYMHSLWCQCGKTRSGIINSARLKVKYDYKCAIKKTANEFESANADEISDHLQNKENNKFWRSWNNKFTNSPDAAVSVAGSSDPMAIEASYRDYYGSIYVGLANVGLAASANRIASRTSMLPQDEPADQQLVT